jgi:hypothetical protein
MNFDLNQLYRLDPCFLRLLKRVRKEYPVRAMMNVICIYSRLICTFIDRAPRRNASCVFTWARTISVLTLVKHSAHNAWHTLSFFSNFQRHAHRFHVTDFIQVNAMGIRATRARARTHILFYASCRYFAIPQHLFTLTYYLALYLCARLLIKFRTG